MPHTLRKSVMTLSIVERIEGRTPEFRRGPKNYEVQILNYKKDLVAV
jgi:hypothetical protein